jgi:hypothetical protein
MLCQHCLLAEGDIGAPIYWRTDAPCAITNGTQNTKMTNFLGKKYHINHLLAGRTKRSGPNILVRRAYFHTNQLLTGLYIEETEIR